MCPSAKCLIEIITFPPSVNVYRQRLCMAACDLQEHKRWDCAVEKRNFFCMVTKTTVTELELHRSRTECFGNWNCRRYGDETSLERTGIRCDSREPCRESICESMVIQTRFRTDEACHEVHVRARCRAEEQTTLAYVNTKSNKADLMTKCHTFEAHRKGCAMLGLKLSRDDGKLA